MLEILRAYGLGRLTEVGEHTVAAAALARHALQVAEQAAVGLRTSAGERAAAWWLDAEDATTQQALAWALEYDPATALRLAVALAPWWQLRGRWVAANVLLLRAADQADAGSELWCAARLWLGHSADDTGYMVGALDYFTAVRDALAAGPPSRALADALNGRSNSLLNLGHIPEGAEEARRALELAQETGDRLVEARALLNLGVAARYAGDLEDAVAYVRQASQIDQASIPARFARRCASILTAALIEADEVTAAKRSCADGLALARQAGDLWRDHGCC